jgi:DNA-binding CsgD family transcriptional regulator
VISLVGRTSEQAEIGRLVERARNGRSGVLVIRGEAGIGKTCLLDAVASSATDVDVVRHVGIESEMRLGFAALQQLLSPFLDGIESLPAPQARALKAAFGISDDVAPDPFLVGLAALTLVTTAAATGRPLLIVFDDTQWLDQESADAIGFLARRLYADRICLLVSMRDSIEDRRPFDGLPELTLAPLSEAESVALLDAAVGAPLADAVLSRLLADARGNPLALVEFSRELSPDQVSGTVQLPEQLAVDRKLERRFLRQVGGLPPATQRLLLVAAAEPTGDVGLILGAGRDLNFDEHAITPARAAGLLELGPQLAFRHPLIRSAVYQGASHADRCRAHEALAFACDAERDPDRRAWHRGIAAQLPDDEVAAELERAAQRAGSRGSCAASAALLARAAQLTPDPGMRAIRLLQAAAAHLTAGSSVRAQTNVAQAFPDLHDPLLLARARQLEAAIAYIDSFPGTRPSNTPGRAGEILSMMLDAARAMEGLDIALARDAMLEAIPMAIYFGGASNVSAVEVARVARSFKLASGTAPSGADLLLDAIAELIANGHRSAAPLLHDALAAAQTDPEIRRVPRLVARACWIAFALSDDEALGTLADECAATSREQGAFQVLPEAVNYQGLRALRVGSLTVADDLFTENIDMHVLLHRQSGPGEAAKLIVSAWRGRETEIRAKAAALSAEAPELALVIGYTDYALMLLELGLGNYHAASSLAREHWNEDIALGGLRAADTIEAHARGGTREAAQTALTYLAERAAANQSRLDLGLLARCHALLASDADAEAHFRRSIVELEGPAARLQLARSQLVYGEWLRRQKRRRDARTQLEAARDIFESMGAIGFAERARVELLATGAKARKRADETRHDLTPQESQIARLAAGGATNPEIAARLFISANTVDYHLRKVYRKLDIKSRRELGSILPVD